jgi:hypothetical protein
MGRLAFMQDSLVCAHLIPGVSPLSSDVAVHD